MDTYRTPDDCFAVLPDFFADEIRQFIVRADELKVEAAAMRQHRAAQKELQAQAGVQPEHAKAQTATSAEHTTAEQPGGDSGSAWASPFEWRRSDKPSTPPPASAPAYEESQPTPSLITSRARCLFERFDTAHAAWATAS